MATNQTLQNINDQNVRLDKYLRSTFQMDLKTYKILKNTLLSILVLAFGVYLVHEGGDPSTIGMFVISLLAVLNGLEISEFYAALSQAQDASSQDSDNSE